MGGERHRPRRVLRSGSPETRGGRFSKELDVVSPAETTALAGDMLPARNRALMARRPSNSLSSSRCWSLTIRNRDGAQRPSFPSGKFGARSRNKVHEGNEPLRTGNRERAATVDPRRETLKSAATQARWSGLGPAASGAMRNGKRGRRVQERTGPPGDGRDPAGRNPMNVTRGNSRRSRVEQPVEVV